MNNRIRLATAIVVVLLTAGFAATGSPVWSGRVVGVIDGDTIDVLHDGRAERIRIAQIDTPEKGQAFGNKAKQRTSDLCFNAVVTVRPETRDRYGRTVAEVLLPDGRSLGVELVRSGFAWRYVKYSNDAHLAALEQEARAARRGLWADSNPVPPWEWRRGGSRESN